jgi:hypothetical protein
MEAQPETMETHSVAMCLFPEPWRHILEPRRLIVKPPRAHFGTAQAYLERM